MRRARRRKDALGWALVAGLFVLLGAAAVGVAALRPPPTDEASLCRTDIALAAHTLIVVDSTDKLEPRHRKRLKAVVDTERARLGPYEKLTIVALRPAAPREPRVLFALCNPGDASGINPLIGNARQAQEKWDKAFGEPLDAALRRAGSGGGASASPILETLAAAAADPDFSPAIARRRLVLVSDLLEHDPDGFSLYAANADFEMFTRLRAGAAPAPDLSGVEVRVASLDREAQAARQAWAKTHFWGPYFEASGAQAIAWDPSL